MKNKLDLPCSRDGRSRSAANTSLSQGKPSTGRRNSFNKPSISLKLLRAHSTERGPSIPDTTLPRGRSLVATQEGQSKPQELDGRSRSLARCSAAAGRRGAVVARAPQAWSHVGIGSRKYPARDPRTSPKLGTS